MLNVANRNPRLGEQNGSRFVTPVSQVLHEVICHRKFTIEAVFANRRLSELNHHARVQRRKSGFFLGRLTPFLIISDDSQVMCLEFVLLSSQTKLELNVPGIIQKLLPSKD